MDKYSVSINTRSLYSFSSHSVSMKAYWLYSSSRVLKFKEFLNMEKTIDVQYGRNNYPDDLKDEYMGY